MREQFRMWGRLDKTHTIQNVIDQLKSSRQWNLRLGAQAYQSTRSTLMDTDFLDVERAAGLRRHLTDVAVVRGSGRGRPRITIRNGASLHFQLIAGVETPSADVTAEHIEQLAQTFRGQMVDLGLEPVGAAVRYAPPAVVVADDSKIGELARCGAGPCLYLYDGVVPVLINRDDGCPVGDNPMDEFYLHSVACMGAQDVLTSVRDTVPEAVSALADLGSLDRSTDDRLTFAEALEGTHRLASLRRDLVRNEARKRILVDFRRTSVGGTRSSPHHERLYSYLDRHFDDYYLGPLETALGAMREGVDEIGEHSTTMLELASLSYDIRIQEKLKTMQWLSLGLAIASLMVAVAAILTAL
ncbi:hypothetical protein ACQEVI_23395 [Promicromonospora sp. CA-289599]|uniref:hypothetical protein n=1 Tax=Promicromonospora sp. CA-289599 TaxID=3240014 RepID=UPI003D8DEDBB